jgi:hypothetical protein
MALPQWRSLRFFDTSRAREVNYLPDGFGIVNFAAVSASEGRIMTYSSNNGMIRYLELSSGDLNHETQTTRDLSLFTLLANRRHALGFRSGELYLVDVVNGATLARTSVGNVEMIIPVSPEENRFYLAEESGGRHRLIPLTVRIGSSSAELRINRTESTGITGVSKYFSGGISGGVFTNDSGNVAYIRDGGYQLMGLNSVSPIRAVTVQGDWLYVLNSNSVSRFREDLLDRLNGRNALDGIETDGTPQIQRLELPLTSPGGLAVLNNTTLLFWDREDRSGIVEYNSFTGSSRRIPVELRAPVRNIRIGDRYIILIDSENGLYLLEKTDYRQSFSYNTLGLIDAIELDSGLILIGKNRSGFFNSSLIEVNPRTSETSVVESSDTVVFEFADNPSGREFYSIGISSENGRSYTVVREYSAGRPGDSRSIMRFNGEDTDAGLEYNTSNRSLVTSAGLDGVSLYQSRRLQSLEDNSNLPRQVFGTGDRVFAVNIDGSMSVWSTRNRQLTHQLISLPNGDILLLNKNASYLALETQPDVAVVDYQRLLVPVIPSGSRTAVLNRIQFLPPQAVLNGTQPEPVPVGTPTDEQADSATDASGPTVPGDAPENDASE